MLSDSSVKCNEWKLFKVFHRNNINALKRMEALEEYLISYKGIKNENNRQVYLQVKPGDGMVAMKNPLNKLPYIYIYIYIGAKMLLTEETDFVSLMTVLGHEYSHIYYKDVDVDVDVINISKVDLMFNSRNEFTRILSVLLETRSDITGKHLVKSICNQCGFYCILKHTDMLDKECYMYGYLGNEDRVRIATKYDNYNNKVVKDVFEIINKKYNSRVTYEGFIKYLLSEKVCFKKNKEVEWVLYLLQDDNLVVDKNRILRK